MKSIGEINRPNCLLFPSRKSEERWPNIGRINDLSCRIEQSATRMGVSDSNKGKYLPPNNGRSIGLAAESSGINRK